MRELKFRAWDNLNKKWLMGYEYPNLGGFSLTGECVLFGEWSNCFDEFLFNKNEKNPEDLIIEQFTGLKDKNGKDIYEGDIVEWKTRRHKSVYTGLREDRDKLQTIKWKSAVEWDMQSFCITESFDPITQRNNSPLVYDESLEVIGNIHENPNILNPHQ